MGCDLDRANPLHEWTSHLIYDQFPITAACLSNLVRILRDVFVADILKAVLRLWEDIFCYVQWLTANCWVASQFTVIHNYKKRHQDRHHYHHHH